jgi:hypothetical protein
MRRIGRGFVSGIISVAVSFALSCAVAVRAEATEIFIDQVRRLAFPPTEAFFLVSFSDVRVVRVAATLVQLGGKNGDDALNSVVGAVARIQIPDEIPHLTYSAVFLGTGSRLEFVAPVRVNLHDASQREVSVDTIREELLQHKAVLGSWRMQVQAQEESLKRLRSDAEILGDFGRIIDKREELDRAKSDLANVERDIENLTRFVKLAKTRPAPANQVGREAQLVKQLSEITQVSHAVELTEIRRRSAAEADLQRKLALIEATRQEDLAGLTSELERLKRAPRPAPSNSTSAENAE